MSIDQVWSAAHVEGSAKHYRLFVVIAEQSILAVVDDDVVYCREVVFADVEFVAVCWNNRKMMYSITVPHRQRVLTLLSKHEQALHLRNII